MKIMSSRFKNTLDMLYDGQHDVFNTIILI